MAPYQKWFTTYKSHNFGFIYMGNDKPCIIIGMRQIKIVMDDSGVRTLNNVTYILKLRKNLISIGILHANNFFYKFDRDKYIMKVNKGALTVMRARNTCGNIYKHLGNTIVDDVASYKFDNDATKL